MWPGSGHGSLLACKVPLAVLDKEVPCQEDQGEGEEEEKAVVEVAVDDAVLGRVHPVEADHLGVHGERDAEAGQQDVPDGQVDQQVVAGGACPFCAQAGHDEQEVAQDGDDDCHHVQENPTPLVLFC